ncbi:Kinesin-like protein KIF19 [Hordeum vulgare]|nr:Kinesin-like protein KIF19 [Hordeum vulgare]
MVNEKDYALFQALTSRRQVILDNICDNDEAGASYRKGMNNVELQIEMESLRSLWNILYGTWLNQKQILKFAAKQGLTVEGCPLPSSSPDVAMPHGRLPPFMSFPSPQSQSSCSPSSCFFQQGFSTMSVLKN